MFQRVRIQITALAVAIVVCIYAISAFAVYGIVRHVVLSAVDTRLTTVAKSITETNLSKLLQSSDPQNTLLLVEPRRKAAQSNLGPNRQQALTAWLDSVDPSRKRFTGIWRQTTATPVRILVIPKAVAGDGRTAMVVGADIAREMNVLDRLAQVLRIVGIVGVVVSALAGFLLAERVLRPIRLAWKRQVDFVGDASHELRTPLAVIQTNLGLVLEHTDQSVADNLEWIHNAHSESRRLTKLVQDLLTLARGDAQKAPVRLDPVDLSELAAHIIELFDPVLAARNLHSDIHIATGMRVVGDRDRLHQLMVILIDNACKFTPDDGTIRVQLDIYKGSARLRIADTGCGISDKDLPRIFDRFYQADTSRAENGSGLGLSIAQWITQVHKGKISVTSRIGVGTEFTILLPLA